MPSWPAFRASSSRKGQFGSITYPLRRSRNPPRPASSTPSHRWVQITLFPSSVKASRIPAIGFAARTPVPSPATRRGSSNLAGVSVSRSSLCRSASIDGQRLILARRVSR